MKRSFSMVPTEAELDSLSRRFDFHPATPDSASTLSPADVASFNSKGYVTPVPVFSQPEIEDIRDYFDQLLARVLASGGDSYSISSAHLRYGRVYDILADDRIVDRVQDLLGPNVVGWGSHFFCKLPGDGKIVDWHQDASYWPLSHTRTVTVWLAIDDAEQENACMQFVSGSHLEGRIEHRSSLASEGNVLHQAIDQPTDYGEVVDVVLAAGQASIHSDLLLHGSGANNSRRRRCGLTLRYCAADVRASLQWHEKGVVLRGVDADGHWSNPPRPTQD